MTSTLPRAQKARELLSRWRRRMYAPAVEGGLVVHEASFLSIRLGTRRRGGTEREGHADIRPCIPEQMEPEGQQRVASFAQEVEEAGSVANPLVLDPWESHLGEGAGRLPPDDEAAAGYPKLVEERRGRNFDRSWIRYECSSHTPRIICTLCSSLHTDDLSRPRLL